jgi:hypothetical protein
MSMLDNGRFRESYQVIGTAQDRFCCLLESRNIFISFHVSWNADIKSGNRSRGKNLSAFRNYKRYRVIWQICYSIV